MIHCHTFVRSAVFAALAAAGWFPWVLAAGPLLGVWRARALYLVGIAVLYAACLSARSARRIPTIVIVALVAAAAASAARTTTELAIGLAALLGIARSAFLYRAAPARAVAVEIPLLAGGLLFARFLSGPTLASTALALWGFLLVQSLFFLVGGVRVRPAADARGDPFEDAHRRALALLEGRGA